MFLATNANKKGLTLDLSSARGRELLLGSSKKPTSWWRD